MRVAIDILVQGLLLGGLYALFALGQSLMFGVMRLTNTAQGDFIVLGGLRRHRRAARRSARCPAPQLALVASGCCSCRPHSAWATRFSAAC